MSKRGLCCAVGVLGILATVCLTIGFVAPGWIVMTRSLVIEEFDIQEIIAGFMIQERQPEMGLDDRDDRMGDPMDAIPIEQDDVPDGRPSDWKAGDMDWEVKMPDGEQVPVDSEDEDRHRPHHHDHHHGHHHGHHHHHCDQRLAEWAINSFGMYEVNNGFEMKTVQLHGSYGLWFSVYCMKVHDDTRDVDGGTKDTCSCVTVDTACALKYAFVFNSFATTIDSADRQLLNSEHMGGASLTEHRIESTISVVFCLIGIIAGIVGFREANGRRCLKYVCALTLLISLPLMLSPALRLAKYSHHKHDLHVHVDVKMPYSVMASLIGCAFLFSTIFVALFGLVRKYRQEAPGKWYKFNNELGNDVTVDVKKPGFVLLAEPLPEKPEL